MNGLEIIDINENIIDDNNCELDLKEKQNYSNFSNYSYCSYSNIENNPNVS